MMVPPAAAALCSGLRTVACNAQHPIRSSRGAECEGCVDTPGTHVVVQSDGADWYTTACSSEAFKGEGPFKQCDTFKTTGRTSPSICGDHKCYLEVVDRGAYVWVVKSECGVIGSAFGKPGDPACPGPGACGPTRGPAPEMMVGG